MVSRFFASVKEKEVGKFGKSVYDKTIPYKRHDIFYESSRSTEELEKRTVSKRGC